MEPPTLAVPLTAEHYGIPGAVARRVARKRRERRERGESRWPGCGVTDAPAAALDALAALGGSALGPAVRAAMGASREHANGLLRHLSRAGLVARGRVEGSGVGKGCAGVRWSLAGRARWIFEARRQGVAV